MATASVLDGGSATRNAAARHRTGVVTAAVILQVALAGPAFAAEPAAADGWVTAVSPGTAEAIETPTPAPAGPIINVTAGNCVAIAPLASAQGDMNFRMNCESSVEQKAVEAFALAEWSSVNCPFALPTKGWSATFEPAEEGLVEPGPGNPLGQFELQMLVRVGDTAGEVHKYLQHDGQFAEGQSASPEVAGNVALVSAIRSLYPGHWVVPYEAMVLFTSEESLPKAVAALEQTRVGNFRARYRWRQGIEAALGTVGIFHELDKYVAGLFLLNPRGSAWIDGRDPHIRLVGCSARDTIDIGVFGQACAAWIERQGMDADLTCMDAPLGGARDEP